MFSNSLLQSYLKLLLGLFVFLGIPIAGNADWIQPPNEFPITTTGIYANSLASDASGHAIVLIGDQSPSQSTDAWFFSNGTWTSTTIIPAGTSISNVAVAMDPNGTALALLHDFTNDHLLTFFFNGITWNPPPTNPLDTISTIAPSMAVTMTGPGQGLAAWTDGTTVKASFFSGGNWGTVKPLGTGDSAVSVALSKNGTAIVGWQDGPNVTVANFVGGVWQGPTVLDPNGTFVTSNNVDSNLQTVGIDASGNALAIWIDSAGNLVSKIFNGTAWSLLPTIIGPEPNNTAPSLAMSPLGTAVAVWVNVAGNGFLATYNGSSWSIPVQFSTDKVNSEGNPAVSVNVEGNALIVWPTVVPSVVSVRLPLAGKLGPQEIIDANPPGSNIFSLFSCLSDNGKGFASWQAITSNPKANFVFASATTAPLPPPAMKGRVCHDRTAIHSDLVNIITWTPSPDPNVVAYYLRRNGELIGIIPATGPFNFVDQNRKKKVTYTYSLTSVDRDGVESTPITVVLTP